MGFQDQFLTLVDQECQSIFALFQCPVIFFDQSHHRLNGQYTANMTPPYKANTTDYLIELFGDVSIQNRPTIIQSHEGLYYIGIDLLHHDIYYGQYIIGPFLDKEYSRLEIIDLYENHKHDYDIQIIENYYTHIKKLNYETIQVYASLCKNMIDGYFFENEDHAFYFQDSIESDIQSIRNDDIVNQREYSRLGYNVDKIMIECVKNGYPGEIKRFIQDYWSYTGRRELLDGTLRDRKNFSIAYVSMLIQAAIEGGMDYDIASRLSLQYIHLIEKKNYSSELERLEIDILYDLSKKVKTIKRQGHTKLIRDCKDYIMENISGPLKVQDIADYFDIDSKYLARRFKKETNETMKNYINRKKVEEAKRIMQSSYMPLIDIATNLSFHDQSHFTKIFKDFAGVTPKQYYRNIKSK